MKEDAFSKGYLIIHCVATSDRMKGYFQSRHQLIYTSNNNFFSFPKMRRSNRNFQNGFSEFTRVHLKSRIGNQEIDFVLPTRNNLNSFIGNLRKRFC